MRFDNQLMAPVALALLTALVVSFLMTPVVKSFAYKVGAIDVPKDERRMHHKPIPRLGGLAIFAGFMASILLFVDIRLNPQMQSILLGAVIIVVLGVVDDIMALPAKLKFVVQIVAALIPALNGVSIQALSNPNIFSPNAYWVLNWLSVPITVLWIVGITNAVNLIDGLDGLANGVSAISAATVLVIALICSEAQVAVVMAALVGACVGFLPYNLNPAKMFMGDTGATFLGFILSTMSIQGLFKFYAVISFAVPFLILGLPIFDTAFAMIRRMAHGPHARGPGPHPSPAHRHGSEPEAGGGNAVRHFRYSGPVRRGADHRRRGEGHAAADRSVRCGGCGRPGGVPQGSEGGTPRGTGRTDRVGPSRGKRQAEGGRQP